jgi:hypothetical protein
LAEPLLEVAACLRDGFPGLGVGARAGAVAGADAIEASFHGLFAGQEPLDAGFADPAAALRGGFVLRVGAYRRAGGTISSGAGRQQPSGARVENSEQLVQLGFLPATEAGGETRLIAHGELRAPALGRAQRPVLALAALFETDAVGRIPEQGVSLALAVHALGELGARLGDALVALRRVAGVALELLTETRGPGLEVCAFEGAALVPYGFLTPPGIAGELDGVDPWRRETEAENEAGGHN